MNVKLDKFVEILYNLSYAINNEDGQTDIIDCAIEWDELMETENIKTTREDIKRWIVAVAVVKEV